MMCLSETHVDASCPDDDVNHHQNNLGLDQAEILALGIGQWPAKKQSYVQQRLSYLAWS